MAGEAQQLRRLIEAGLKTQKHISLVEVVARYDFQNHAIPTIKQMNSALTDLTLIVDRTDNDVLLRRSEAITQAPTLSDRDMELIYAHYTRALRSKRKRGV
jgi:hypothetical protein